MKTQEQIQKETINYLNKTTVHTFIKPKSIFKWGGDFGKDHHNNHYEYDYNDFTYFKVIKRESDFYILENNKLSKLDLDFFIKFYGKNAKCVIKHKLFLGKKVKSIKNTKIVEDLLLLNYK